MSNENEQNNTLKPIFMDVENVVYLKVKQSLNSLPIEEFVLTKEEETNTECERIPCPKCGIRNDWRIVVVIDRPEDGIFQVGCPGIAGGMSSVYTSEDQTLAYCKNCMLYFPIPRRQQ